MNDSSVLWLRPAVSERAAPAVGKGPGATFGDLVARLRLGLLRRRDARGGRCHRRDERLHAARYRCAKLDDIAHCSAERRAQSAADGNRGSGMTQPKGFGVQAVLSFLGAAAMTVTIAGLVVEAIGDRRNGNPAANVERTGVFTGEYVDGAPLYRFPSVSVVADRKAKLANMEREEDPRAPRSRIEADGRPQPSLDQAISAPFRRAGYRP